MNQSQSLSVITTDRRFLNRDTASDEMLQIVGVDTKWQEHIRVLDQQGSLVLLHYLTTLKNDVVDEEPLREIGTLRGTIIDMDTKQVVCRSYPFTPEIVTNDKNLEKTLPEDLSQVSMYSACEGTILRLFWSGKTWQLSTHRKIDAYNSYWVGPTFGELFRQLQEDNFAYRDLDTNYCYIFLMSHNENRLIYNIPEPQLMLISIFSRDEGRFLAPTEYGPGYNAKHLHLKGVVYPQPLAGIDTIETLKTAVEETPGSFNSAGVIILPNPTKPYPIKILSTEYDSLRKARGNDPSLRSRYLQLRGTSECGIIVNWYTEPEYQQVFDDAEDEFEKLVGHIHQLYMNRFIGKDFSQLPKEEFVTLQRCHSWHQQDRANNIVTREFVRKFLNETANYYLLIMLNRQRQQQQ